MTKCEECEGEGQFVIRCGAIDYELIMCDDCGGRGEYDAEPSDAQNPYAKPYDDALAGYLLNNGHVRYLR